MTQKFEVSDHNRVRRVARRGIYDRETVFKIIDAAPVGHVGINDRQHGLTLIPMLHARMDDHLVFHGATTSRLMQLLASGDPVCVSFTLVDGLVLAKSLFHHSMNYRSAVVFGTGRLSKDESEKMEALKAISDKLLPGRWEDARQPNAREMKATAIAMVKIESASAKVREGNPVDDPEDLDFPCWSGVVPIESRWLPPVADSNSTGVEIPDYLSVRT